MAHPFLALGDSYTIGEGVPETERWPVALATRLRTQGIALDNPRIVARTGWTTDELLAAMDTSRFDPPYDLVTLLIGVNDQYRGRTLDEYREPFVTSLQRAIALAGRRAGHVLVVSIPDWGVTPFARGDARNPQRIAAEIDAFNAAAHTLAQAHGARHADITALSRAASCRDLLTADGLHPSGAQYARWLEVIAPAAQSILQASSHPVS